MGHSGDLEILDRQVALLRDLLEDLDRQRQERKGRASPPSDPLEPASPGEEPEPDAPAGLRLVGEEPALTERRPRFREKRAWRLSGAAEEHALPEAEPRAGPESHAGPGPRGTRLRGGPGPAAAVERREMDRERVPWRAYEHLLRDRDDLLVQLVRQQGAEQRLLEVCAAAEGKDEKIRHLKKKLRERERARYDGFLKGLYRRLAEAEELYRVLARRALRAAEAGAGTPAAGAEAMAAKSESGPGKKFWLRGHEVIVTTSAERAGRYYSFALLTVDADGSGEMKGFKARGATSREAELSCIDRVLTYLEDQMGKVAQPRLRSSRNLASIRGRDVDIFCDMVGADSFQAFPFLYDEQGRRHILLRFHLDEAITAEDAEEARLRCVRRLEAFFDEQDVASTRPNP
jgi:hypothetical protein